MKHGDRLMITSLMTLLVAGFCVVASAAKPPPEPLALTGEGEALMATYAEMLASLRAEIVPAVPAIDPKVSASFMDAYRTVGAARGDAWRDKGQFAATFATVAAAQSNALSVAKPILEGVNEFLKGGAHDALLVKCAVIANATPRGLAEFAQQGAAEQQLVKQLLSDSGLMKQMLQAGGARCGKYGEAMQIYAAILKASERARDPGILQRFALGTSLELAVPIIMRSHTKTDKASTTAIDPVKRYLHYEKAFLDGELDPAFDTLTVWECRFVPKCECPDEELAWGREMLRTYRPDHIFTEDYKWRYSKSVKTDVKYGGKNPSIPELGFFQDILNTGGVCGKRAFFGRFMLRAYGIPTFGMRQRGHAAVSHWTPDGWTMNFGAHWRWGWWDRPGHEQSGEDFLLETQSRRYPSEFIKVLRAAWVAEALGEERRHRRTLGSGGLWNALALYQQRAIVSEERPAEVALAGEDLAEANESTRAEIIMKAKITPADRAIATDTKGIITVPAVACSTPTNNTAKIAFMKSFAGGMQLHYGRLGDAEPFVYSIEVPKAGTYRFVAEVATVNVDQHVQLAVNSAAERTTIPMPYTIGLWGTSEPVNIALAKGDNTLQFTREAPNYGMTIKQFTLTPVE